MFWPQSEKQSLELQAQQDKAAQEAAMADLRKTLEELEEQRASEVEALKAGADGDRGEMMEQIRALAAQKSELENRLKEREAELTGKLEEGRKALQDAETRLREVEAARKADEVRHHEKVAVLEDDKAKTIAAMVEDKNAMINRIKADLEDQNKARAGILSANRKCEGRGRARIGS